MVRILTLNCFMVPVVAPEQSRRLDGIVAGINELEPDVVLLQEVFLPWQKSALIRLLPRYPYYYLPRAGLFCTGGGLCCFSRLPLTQASFNFLPSAGHWWGLALADRLAAKGFMTAVVGGSWPFQLIHTHLDRTYKLDAIDLTAVQRPQLVALTRVLQSIPHNKPCVVAGDFNVQPNTKAFNNFLTEDTLQNLTPGNEPSLIINRYRPKKLFAPIHAPERLDYVLYRGPVVRSSWQYAFGREPWLSDHLGILIDIEPGVFN